VTRSPVIEVRVGQEWEDCNPHERGRTLLVVEVVGDTQGPPYALCEILTNSDRVTTLLRCGEPHVRDRRGCRVRIRIDRFRPGATGYRLLKDVA
jgi:hypothetical protein